MSVCKVTVIGCGGTGASLLSLLGPTPGVPQFLMDTSDSKWSVVGAHVEKMLIGTTSAEGAGKNRTKHAVAVDTHVQRMFAAASTDMSGNTIPGMSTDITILMYSASGGSGSVIGPIYAQYLRSAGRKTIECVAMANNSAVDIANNNGTLKTLSNYAINQVVPILLVPSPSHTKDFRSADQELVDQVKLIIHQMTDEVIGIDTNDRLSAIRPNRNGMYMVISSEEDTSAPNQGDSIVMKNRKLTEFPALNNESSSAVNVPVYSALLFRNAKGHVWNVDYYSGAIGDGCEKASLLMLEQGNARVNELIVEGDRNFQAKKAAVNSSAVAIQSWTASAATIVAADEL